MSFISPISKRISSCASSVTQCITDYVPAFTPSNEKFIKGVKWVGKHVSSPQQRLILGATALMSQPFIDLHNRHVDEDTRKVSAMRTIAKIIAGTTTGYLVRYGCNLAVEKFINAPVEGAKAWKSLLYPKKIVEVTELGLQHYKLSLGSIIALGVMMFTNFAIDAPLTKYLTNKFIDKAKETELNKLKEAA